MSITAYPLTWPTNWKRTNKSDRKRAKFEMRGDVGYRRLSMAGGIERVMDQLARLGVTTREDVVISTNVRTRLDGLPYGNEPEPADPGVAVYWRIAHGAKTQSMAIDIYDRVADNVGAVALTISYMRGIERHGGAEILERVFLGFQQIEPPIDWKKILGIEGEVTVDKIQSAYRKLALKHHPDHGGNADAFADLNAAVVAAKASLGLQ